MTGFDPLFTFDSDPCFCNGNGDRAQCESLGICVCVPGYTGRADFSIGLYSCHINNAAIIALWSLVLAAVLLSAALSFTKVKTMIAKFLRTRTRMKKKGKVYTLRSHRGLTVVLIMYGVVLPLLAAMAILRIADDQQRVGLTIPFTILWTLLYIAFATALHRYTTAIATAMLKAEQSTNSYIARGRWFGRGLLISQSLLTVYAYPVLIQGGSSTSTSRISMILYLVSGVVVFSITAFWSRWVRKQTATVLDEHPEHGELKGRMLGMLTGVARHSLVIAFIFTIAVSIPILWTVRFMCW